MSIYESVKKSIEFIENNIERDIGVIDVSCAVSYSQFYFSRKFSDITHISIYDYIIKRKISESYKYLIRTDSKVVDVAFQYGFKSHEVYTRAFKKVLGMTPKEIKAYDSLALFNCIDEDYLRFLKLIKFEVLNQELPNCYFKGIPTDKMATNDNHLLWLSADNLYKKMCIFKGDLSEKRDKFLSFKLKNLKHKIRIYSQDVDFAFRFFIDNYYDINEMESNYMLIKHQNGFIDIVISGQ